LFDDSIFVFRAQDYAAAFQTALIIGQSEERNEYLNSDGQRVVWKFVEILTLDSLQSTDPEKMEVYSEFVDVGEGKKVSFDARFDPQLSKPEQTLNMGPTLSNKASSKHDR
jgi:uncharacterized protein DUF4288